MTSSVATSFLEGLAAQDFDRVASAFSADAHLLALLPGGLREWDGVEEIKHRFARWFGNTEAFELVDATASGIGSKVRLVWRARVQAERLGPGWFVVEQQGYAETDDDDRIRRLSLVCSGYLAELGET